MLKEYPKEYCVVLIGHNGIPIGPLEDERGLIKSKNVEMLMESAAIHAPRYKKESCKRMDIMEFRGELRPFIAVRTGQKYAFGEMPIASYNLN